MALELVELAPRATCHRVRPIEINLSAHFLHTLDAIRDTKLLLRELKAFRETNNMTESCSISLSTLSNLRDEWLTVFDWEAEQEEMNQRAALRAGYSLCAPQVPRIGCHSSDSPSWVVRIILGYSSLDTLIPRLTRHEQLDYERTFHVVIPSLPGYGLSSPAPDGWYTTDFARKCNTLMTDILGYSRYAVQGSDWVCRSVAYPIYTNHKQTAGAAHFSQIPFAPSDMGTSTTGSDPRQGTGPSLLTHKRIIHHVSCMADADAPRLFSQFKWNTQRCGRARWLRKLVAWYTTSVSHSMCEFREFDGHFPKRDDPDAVSKDKVPNYPSDRQVLVRLCLPLTEIVYTAFF
ncbi:hypothetical protein NLU13_7600 [Sarocladium strictum]|uniref:Uncharacterized protein n=1 Tax=Sarocladium strictum TaxID=5046 RepID=A0AA39GFG8_SARSR|nr:hypothetical protein NLU13_7600 [Sarocladium strictum]